MEWPDLLLDPLEMQWTLHVLPAVDFPEARRLAAIRSTAMLDGAVFNSAKTPKNEHECSKTRRGR